MGLPRSIPQSLLTLLLTAALAAAQQPNSPAASLVLAGINGPGAPIDFTLNVAEFGPNPIVPMRASGGAGMTVTIAVSLAGVQPNAAVLGAAGSLDLDLQGPLLALVDGFGVFQPANPGAMTDASGVLAIAVPVAGIPGGLEIGHQAAILDPASAVGLTLTAATLIRYTDTPVAAIHVSRALGTAAGPGTSLAPFDTIQRGINAAAAVPGVKPPVLVASDTYHEDLVLRDGVSVFGDLDGSLWIRNPFLRTTVVSSHFGASAANLGLGSASTHIVAFTFHAADAPVAQNGVSSIAMIVTNCTFRLMFQACEFISGNGRDGIAGANGSNGANGGFGSTGQNPNPFVSGGPGGSGSGGSFPGGAGGTGAFGPNAGQAGGAAPSGSPGGAGGTSGGCGGTGGNGAPGVDGVGGSRGANGTPGAPIGTLSTGGVFFASFGSAGTAGSSGRGGGGGGGGGGAMDAGSICLLPMAGGGGGGGGGGGIGGQGGQGGQSGGASIAIITRDSSTVFFGCSVRTGQGGRGGDGGFGGVGGSGGLGANGGLSVVGLAGASGRGGRGGSGGSGASGGRGGAGSGGASIGLLRIGAIQPGLIGGFASILGQPGLGGTGGTGGQTEGAAPSGIGQSIQ